MKQMKKTYIVPQIKAVNLGLDEHVADVVIGGGVAHSAIEGGIDETMSHRPGRGDDTPPFVPLKTNVWEDDW